MCKLGQILQNTMQMYSSALKICLVWPGLILMKLGAPNGDGSFWASGTCQIIVKSLSMLRLGRFFERKFPSSTTDGKSWGSRLVFRSKPRSHVPKSHLMISSVYSPDKWLLGILPRRCMLYSGLLHTMVTVTYQIARNQEFGLSTLHTRGYSP